MNRPTRFFSLSDGPGERGLACDQAGLRLAGASLLHKDENGFRPRNPEEVAALLAYAYGERDEPVSVSASGLETVARALNQGDLAKAMTAAVFLRVPDLDPEGAARIARMDAVLAKYAGQPRSANGRFAEGKQSGGASSSKTPPAGRPAAPPTPAIHVAKAADLGVPDSPAEAPKAIRFSPALQKQFDALWAKSRPNGNAEEWGALIVADKAGNLSLQNTVHGKIYSAAGQQNPKAVLDIPPNTTLKEPQAYRIVGFFHTHPYALGYTDISLSGADDAFLSQAYGDANFNFIVAQSGSGQFLALVTKKTPRYMDAESVNVEIGKKTYSLMETGNPQERGSFSGSSRGAEVEAAEKYHFAYYEGSHGLFRRRTSK